MKKIILILIVGLFSSQGFSQMLRLAIVTAEIVDSTQIKDIKVEIIQAPENMNFYMSDSLSPALDFADDYCKSRDSKRKVLRVLEAKGRYLKVLALTTGEYLFNPKLICLFGNTYAELKESASSEKNLFTWPKKVDFEERIDIGRWFDGKKHIPQTVVYERIKGINIPIKYIDGA